MLACRHLTLTSIDRTAHARWPLPRHLRSHHLGHIDIIRRAATLVDKLVIGVAINRDKGPLFSLEERVALIEAECDTLPTRQASRLSSIRLKTC